MQLAPAAAVAVTAACVTALFQSPARADGEVSVRGAYYKERSTRIQQPMVDTSLDVGEHGAVDAHFLVDVITSASVASGQDGDEFQEVRYEHGANYTHLLQRIFQLGGGYRFSVEPDYTSAFGTLRGQAELAQRNTTFAFSVSGGYDRVSNSNAGGGLSEGIEDDVKTGLASLTVSQVLSPVALVSLTYDVSYLNGFLQNPYRQVAVVMANGEPDTVLENVPGERLRHAAFGSLRAFVPRTTTTVVAGYRFYIDDWGIMAHTPEVRLIQPLRDDDSAFARLRYRYYRQSAADFYRDVYDMPQQFMTDDPKLGVFTTHTVGLQVTSALENLGVTGDFADARLEVVVEYLDQNNRFGNALVGQLALTIPIRY